MSEDVKTVIDYYQNCNEDNRMAENPLEYIRCKEIISRFLYRENLSILDIGGATGAFSFWLAEKGHKVSLIDFTPKHIEIAKAHEKEKGITLFAAVVGDARDLPFEDNSFDLILLMGPLYHLKDRSDRIKAIKEAYRVLKPGGKMICEYISRYASMVDGLIHGLVNDPEFTPIMKKDIESGIHINTSKEKSYYTDGYFHHPTEAAIELEEAGFMFEDLIAVTSFGFTINDLDNKLKDETYRNILLETIRKVEKEPSLMGISSHYISISEKE